MTDSVVSAAANESTGSGLSADVRSRRSDRRHGFVGLLVASVARVFSLIVVVFLVSLGTFLLLELVSGDPAVAILGTEATPEQYAQIRDQLGLDQPFVERYIDWLTSALRGDLGQSMRPPNQDVTEMIRAGLPVTLEIAFLSTAMALLAAVPIALWSAYRPGRSFDRLASGATFGAISVPSFLGALLLIQLLVFNQSVVRWTLLLGGLTGAFALIVAPFIPAPNGERQPRTGLLLRLGGVGALALLAFLAFALLPDFPRQGFVRLTDERGVLENLRSAFLPALTLAIAETAVFARLLRSDLISTLQEDFILAARAKGMPTYRILLSDALRPSMFSLMTVAGVALGRLIGGTIIVERIFNLPGMGTMIVDAVTTKDLPVVQGGVLVLAVVYVLINALVDMSYSYMDPRLRRGRP